MRLSAAVIYVGRFGLYALTSFVVAMVLAISVGPRFLPYQTFVVLSASMAPRIAVGSVIVAVPVDRSDIAVDDVITYQRVEEPDLPVTHRIVALRAIPGALVARTKGDANEVADPWEVQLGQTVLRVAVAIPFAGYVLYFSQTTVGRVVTIGVPLAALAAIGTCDLLAVRRRTDLDTTTTAAAA
jgi:signal peptidase